MGFATINARRRALRTVGGVAAVVTTALAGDMGAAPGAAATARTARAADQPDPEKVERGTLTIEALLVDPDRRNERQPAAAATVSIEGREDRPGRTTRDGPCAWKVRREP